MADTEKTMRKEFPVHFQIQTVNACNGKCIMCPYSLIKKTHAKYMNDDLFEKIIKEIADEAKFIKDKVEVTLMLQNEPFLDPKLTKRIKFVKKFDNLCVDTATNCSLLNHDLVEKLESSGIDSLTLSIDSINKKTFEEIRPWFDFDKIMQNIELIRHSELRNKSMIRMVLQKKNCSEIKDFIRFWKGKGFRIEVRNASNRSGVLQNFNDIKISIVFDDETKKFFKDYDVKKSSQYSTHFCNYLFSKFNILSNGDIIKCCHDWSHEDIMGNIKRDTIKKIWDSKFKEHQSLFLKGESYKIKLCKNCSLTN